ncbi:MAG: hypothetical protein ACMXYF_00620 [Candidatus Woesearchaeota archaeon]
MALMTARGQVTVFLIIGLIVFMAFALLLTYQPRTSVEDLSPADATPARIAVETYLRQCLQESADTATKTILSQGGLWFESQGGSDNDENFDFDKPVVLRHDVLPRHSPPYYPHNLSGRYNATLEELYIHFHEQGLLLFPLFGRIDPRAESGNFYLPRLCDLEGPNWPGHTDHGRTCESDVYDTIGSVSSIQNKIQSYTTGIFQNCIESLSGRDAPVAQSIAQESFIHVIYSNDGVEYVAKVPTQVNISDVTLRLNDISYTQPLRIKPMYNLIFFGMREETINASFMIENASHWDSLIYCNYNGTNSLCLLPGLQITRENKTYEDRHYDLITVVDTQVPRRVFSVYFENRPPIIEYPSYSPFVVQADETFNITPRIIDPDGDTVWTVFSRYNGSEWINDTLFRFNESQLYEEGDYSLGCPGNVCANYTVDVCEFAQLGTHNFRLYAADRGGPYDFFPIDITVKPADNLDSCSGSVWDACATGMNSTCVEVLEGYGVDFNPADGIFEGCDLEECLGNSCTLWGGTDVPFPQHGQALFNKFC